MPDPKCLTNEQRAIYEALSLMVRSGVGVACTVKSAKLQIKVLEALSERNRLLKRYQWRWDGTKYEYQCICCGAYTPDLPGKCKPDCAIADALEGVPDEG